MAPSSHSVEPPAFPGRFKLLNWTDAITVLTHDHPDTIPPDHAARLARAHIPLDHRRLDRFEGEGDTLRAVRLTDGGVLPCEAAFFYLGQRPRSELARQLGCKLTEKGHIEQDDRQRTTVPGVFAAGDIAPPIETVAVAIAQGQVAANEINRSLYEPFRHFG